MNASVNLYMYVGGTNYGFTAGANFVADTQTTDRDVTSYDYDSPINESGDVTEKWKVIKELISQFEPVPPGPTPTPQPKGAYGKVSMKFVNELLNETVLSFISHSTTSVMPKSFADLHQRLEIHFFFSLIIIIINPSTTITTIQLWIHSL